MVFLDNAGREERCPVAHQDNWLEGAGLAASMLCLVHCLALPLLLAILPVFASAIVASARFHVWLLLLVVPTTGVALIFGRKRHGTWWPLFLGTAGLVLIAGGAFVLSNSWNGALITVAGSLLVTVAHLANWRLRRMRSIWKR